jgi:hypothetical protein
VSRYAALVTTDIADTWEKFVVTRAALSTIGNSENRSVSTRSQSNNNDTLKVDTIVQQIMRELSETVIKEDKIIR